LYTLDKYSTNLCNVMINTCTIVIKYLHTLFFIVTGFSNFLSALKKIKFCVLKV